MQNNPAEHMVGLELTGGWRVVEKVERPKDATGGFSSIGYLVEGPGDQLGFMKAIDLSSAFLAEDQFGELRKLTQAVLFEREVSKRCVDGRMRRVVAAVASGSVEVDLPPPLNRVEYFIFERAGRDLRLHLAESDWFDVAWILRALHHVTTGLFQLHNGQIAHQDVKPSNVLVFEQIGAKVADLGKAAARGVSAPHDDDQIAGDVVYAPPELLYGQIDPEWNRRRYGCDAYLLGSLVVTLFAGTTMTGLISSEMDGEHHWRQWRGDYAGALPYVRDGFGRAVATFGETVWDEFRSDISQIVRELCDPDPSLRGHPHNRIPGSNQYSLERYVSRFNVLASKAEAGNY